MSGPALCWVTVAVALSSCRSGLAYDYATWPTCPVSGLRTIKRGETSRQVTWLNLEHCNITTLYPSELVFSGLDRLDLQYNNIETIPTGAFDSLISILSLYLNDNRFLGKDLPSSLFRYCFRINRIAFSGNDMSDTPADLLQGLNNLEFLDCDNCSLRVLPTFITLSHTPIKRLSLDHNQLMRLDDPAAFVKLTNLDSLILEHNQIDSVHEDILNPLTKIRYVTMLSNKMRYVPERLFQNKPSLRIINLSKNLIVYIPDNAFFGNVLSILDLSHNRLFYLSENLFSVVRSGIWGLPRFYFDGNPLVCGCLKELLVKLRQQKILYRTSRYDGKHKNCIMLNDFKCYGPNTWMYFQSDFVGRPK